jgi:hypothetical protein
LDNFFNDLRNFNDFFNVVVNNYDLFSDDWNFLDDLVDGDLVDVYRSDFGDLDNLLNDFLDLDDLWNFNHLLDDFFNVSWDFNNLLDNSFSRDDSVSVYNHFLWLSNYVVDWLLNCDDLSVLDNLLNDSLNFDDLWHFDDSFNDLLDDSWHLNDLFSH